MLHLKQYIIKMFFLFFAFNFCYYVVYANNATNYGSAGDTSLGGPTGGAWIEYGPINFVGYRITLVDSSGKKVKNPNNVDTRSVDFTYFNFGSTDSNAKIVASISNGIFKKPNGEGVNNKSVYLHDYKLINSNYKYRFGENASGDYIMIGSNILPGVDDTFRSAEYRNFADTYIQKFDENIIFCPSVWDSDNACTDNNKVDFIGLFLYYSKYLDTPKQFSKVDDQKLQKYFLAFEPLFGSSYPYMYGTGYEWLMYMSNFENDTTASGFMQNFSNERSSFACSLYTVSSFKTRYPEATMFENYFDSYDSCTLGSLGTIWDGIAARCTYLPNHTCGYSPWVNVYKNLLYFRDNQSKNASGVAMVSLDIEGYTPPESNTILYDLNLCDGNEVLFKENNSKPLVDSAKYYKDDIFNQNVGSDPVQALYCHDNVTFNFKDTIEKVSGTKQLNTIMKSSSVPPIIGTVTRICYNYTGSGIATDIEESYNKNIVVDMYGKKYNFKPNYDVSTKKTIYQSAVNKIIKYQYDIKYELQSDINLSVSDLKDINLNTTNNGYVDFSQFNQMFGASNQLITTINNTGNSDLCDDKDYKCIRQNSNSYGLKVTGITSGQCPFQYKVDGNLNSEMNTSIKFRVISLDNPFPARDGTSRLPGKNWLNSDNFVYDYITNNRGIMGIHYNDEENVSPEVMYSELKPMYTVVLTPSTMLKIRNYNKNYSYYSMFNIDSSYETAFEDLRTKDNDADKISCNSNGRECYSSFLRKRIDSKDFTGECVISYNVTGNTLRNNLNDVTVLDTTSSDIEDDLIKIANGEDVEYNSKNDLNKNGRIDSYDYLISLNKYKNKNTKFYTCANKTFLSGGPVEGVDD